MKLKKNFFHLARMILLMSAPVLISGTPGVAATVAHSTPADVSAAVVINNATPVLVNNYAGMLQSLVSKNEDQEHYNAASMSNQILCNVDEQGNRSYEAVENKGEETMQCLTLEDTNHFHAWLNDQLADNKESAYAVASTDKAENTTTSYHGIGHKKPITDPTAAALLFTPDQTNKVNNTHQTLGFIPHSPFAANIFDQQAIVAAFVAWLTSHGLHASAGTINTVASGLQYGAYALLGIAALPIIAEFTAHCIEGRNRSNYALKSDIEAKKIRALITREAKNEEIATAAKKIKVEGHNPVPMVYGYTSGIAEGLATFATNWRNGFAPALKIIGFNTVTDELHVSLSNMDDVAGELKKLQNQQDELKKAVDAELMKVSSAISTPPSRRDKGLILITARPGSISSIETNQLLNAAGQTTLESLQAAKKNCLVKAVEWSGQKLSSAVGGAVKLADDKWEAFQMRIRNAGYKPLTIVPDDSKALNQASLNFPQTGRSSTVRVSNNQTYGNSYQTDDSFDSSGRDPHTCTAAEMNEMIADLAGRPSLTVNGRRKNSDNSGELYFERK